MDTARVFELTPDEQSDLTKLLHKQYPRLSADSRYLHKLREQEVKRSLETNDYLVLSVQQRMLTLQFPHLFLITDSSGMVLYVNGSEQVVKKAGGFQICTGSSFALEHAGLNAVSASIELHRPSIVCGEEHSLKILNEWNSCCTPIAGKDRAISGFLVVFTDMTFDCSVLINLLGYISSVVGHDILEKTDDDINLDQLLNPFQLTNREKEVMRYWFLDYDYKQIGQLLKMSPATVKVNVTNVYNKMNVNSKASFILKVLGII
ncbi:LuxR C-terminal-related transcriptional regulator [Paenibacillus tarimensis]|nr:LuxR C-terminal-related transcriptional regulator [Paenibacillus tarimensis]